MAALVLSGGLDELFRRLPSFAVHAATHIRYKDDVPLIARPAVHDSGSSDNQQRDHQCAAEERQPAPPRSSGHDAAIGEKRDQRQRGQSDQMHGMLELELGK
jgi:hypothetical protein